MPTARLKTFEGILSPVSSRAIRERHGLDQDTYKTRERYILSISEKYARQFIEAPNFKTRYHQEKLEQFLKCDVELQTWRGKDRGPISATKNASDDTDDVFWRSIRRWMVLRQSTTNRYRKKKAATATQSTNAGSAEKVRLVQRGGYDWKGVVIKIKCSEEVESNIAVGVISEVANHDVIHRKDLTRGMFMGDVQRAMGMSLGKQWPVQKAIMYEAKSSSWDLTDESDFNAALMLFEQSEEAEIGSMLTIIAGKKSKPVLGDWFLDASDNDEELRQKIHETSMLDDMEVNNSAMTLAQCTDWIGTSRISTAAVEETGILSAE